MEDPTAVQITPHIHTPIPVFPLVALAVIVGSLSVFTAYQYQQYRVATTQTEISPNVLGAKDTATFVDSDSIAKSFKDSNRTVTLYAPDKSYVFPLENIASCVQFTGGASENGVACKDVATTVDASCIDTYFKNNPDIAVTRKILTGEDATVQVRVQDWTVDTAALAAQIKDAMTKEVSYCDVTGQKEGRKNIASLQVAVSDTKPGVEEPFAPQFVEIDKSKALLYMWNNGAFKTFAVKIGTRLPTAGIYRLDSLDLKNVMKSSQDAVFVGNNTQKSEYLVVHE